MPVQERGDTPMVVLEMVQREWVWVGERVPGWDGGRVVGIRAFPNSRNLSSFAQHVLKLKKKGEMIICLTSFVYGSSLIASDLIVLEKSFGLRVIINNNTL